MPVRAFCCGGGGGSCTVENADRHCFFVFFFSIYIVVVSCGPQNQAQVLRRAIPLRNFLTTPVTPVYPVVAPTATIKSYFQPPYHHLIMGKSCIIM